MFELKIDTKNQCRACLTSNGKFSSIFDDNLNEIYTELTLLEVGNDVLLSRVNELSSMNIVVIFHCDVIQVKECDKFSKELCFACVQRLKAIKKFRKLCIKSHQIFTEESQAVSSVSETVEEMREVTSEDFLNGNNPMTLLMETHLKKNGHKKPLKCSYEQCQNRYFTKQERFDEHMKAHLGKILIFY